MTVNLPLHNLLALVLPTNEPETFESIFMTGIDNFTEMIDYCSIEILFQPPWTKELAEKNVKILEDKGFVVNYRIVDTKFEYDDAPRILHIRNESIQNRDAEIFCLVDDDMRFLAPSPKVPKSAGAQYLDIVHYMIKNPDCGVVQTGSSLFRSVPLNCIDMVSTDTLYTTGRGVFYRNLRNNPYLINNGIEHNNFTTLDALSIEGGFEERVLAVQRLMTGMYPAKIPAGRVRHAEFYYDESKSRNDKDAVVDGQGMYGWLDMDVCEKNAFKWIMEHGFDNPTERQKKQIRSRTRFLSIDNDLYLERGGLQYGVTTRDGSKLLDYHGSSTEDVENDLLNKLGRMAP